MSGMSEELFSIGAMSRLSGVPIKTLRFYSDEGLLPPSERSRSGYRLYGRDALVRLDLIVTLREAGLGLCEIRTVLARELSLSGALRLRLRAIEANIAAMQRVAAAIRAALRSEPSEADIRRLHAVTKLSNDERRRVIERFFEQVSEGLPIDEAWSKKMIDASAPRLPDEPTAAQLDAWIELSEIVSDPGFIAAMRESAAGAWGAGVDSAAYQRASDDAVAAAREAIARGDAPTSPEAAAMADRFVAAWAAAQGKPNDASFRAELLQRCERHDPRATRYWELVAVIHGWPQHSSQVREWTWLNDAIKTRLR
ncbi:Transcriptional regulator, MerR family protein [Minicystis rosea]|nr:Transcriptional regulator, MerR family protein [Minicystis rosea]